MRMTWVENQRKLNFLPVSSYIDLRYDAMGRFVRRHDNVEKIFFDKCSYRHRNLSKKKITSFFYISELITK